MVGIRKGLELPAFRTSGLHRSHFETFPSTKHLHPAVWILEVFSQGLESFQKVHVGIEYMFVGLRVCHIPSSGRKYILYTQGSMHPITKYLRFGE